MSKREDISKLSALLSMKRANETARYKALQTETTRILEEAAENLTKSYSSVIAPGDKPSAGDLLYEEQTRAAAKRFAELLKKAAERKQPATDAARQRTQTALAKEEAAEKMLRDLDATRRAEMNKRDEAAGDFIRLLNH